jgi:hypothetical protein
MFRWNEAGNIWSGDKKLAVLTNPTELAFRKGNLKRHYPVEFNGETYPDVEAAYQKNKGYNDKAVLMTELIRIKFVTYPEILEAVIASGGESFLKACSHFTGSKNKYWEGNGFESKFICCLVGGLRQALPTYIMTQ